MPEPVPGGNFGSWSPEAGFTDPHRFPVFLQSLLDCNPKWSLVRLSAGLEVAKQAEGLCVEDRLPAVAPAQEVGFSAPGH